MNTIVISKGPFSAELTEVLHKNGCDPIKTVKNPALAAAKFMGKQNIVVYEWSEDPQEETRNLQELMKQTTGLKVLLIVDEGIKEAIKVLVKYDEVYRSEYQSFEDAYIGIKKYVEVYNKKRLHLSIGYLPPDEFEKGLKKLP